MRFGRIFASALVLVAFGCRHNSKSTDDASGLSETVEVTTLTEDCIAFKEAPRSCQSKLQSSTTLRIPLAQVQNEIVNEPCADDVSLGKPNEDKLVPVYGIEIEGLCTSVKSTYTPSSATRSQGKLVKRVVRVFMKSMADAQD